MKKASGAALCAVAVVVAVLLCEAPLTAKGAVTCNPLELISCIPAITSSAQQSTTCCGKLREQIRPCLCGYIKNPNLKQYVGSPGAKKVASICGVSSLVVSSKLYCLWGQ